MQKFRSAVAVCILMNKLGRKESEEKTETILVNDDDDDDESS